MQNRYWNYMKQVKFVIDYLDLWSENLYRKDMSIKVFSAIMSSSSIAAWAIWQKYAFLWALLIAILQVINAVKAYIPYGTTLKNIASSQKNMKLLYNKMEHNWFQVQSGVLSEAQINEMLYDYKNEYVEIENEIFKDGVHLTNKKLVKQADDRTNTFFENNFIIKKSISEKGL